jgi:hypothetical protein
MPAIGTAITGMGATCMAIAVMPGTGTTVGTAAMDTTAIEDTPVTAAESG